MRNHFWNPGQKEIFWCLSDHIPCPLTYHGKSTSGVLVTKPWPPYISVEVRFLQKEYLSSALVSKRAEGAKCGGTARVQAQWQQMHPQFEARLGYTARFCLRIKKSEENKLYKRWTSFSGNTFVSLLLQDHRFWIRLNRNVLMYSKYTDSFGFWMLCFWFVVGPTWICCLLI